MPRARIEACSLRLRAGQRVRRGEELGTFRFGGSTHCLVFRPETRLAWAPGCGDAVPLNAVIATASAE